MSLPFLKQVADHILTSHKDRTETLCIVMPNKRAGLFLRSYLSDLSSAPIWMPRIMGAEEFFNELSGLNVLEEIDLLCLLYESYTLCYNQKADSFENFSKWGNLILQDFNEIDRYLADHRQLYNNLKNIKELENWSLSETILSEPQKDYLEFMGSLGRIYETFNSKLISNGQAYQGMVYRKALENVNTSNFTENYSKVLFCGFNALNAAEEKVLQHLYRLGKAEFLWDADAYYVNQDFQEAGFFLRKNMRLLPDVRNIEPEENYKTEKHIQVIAVPKQMGQAQLVKQELQDLLKLGVNPNRIAVVLANEKLLWPLLSQLPEDIGQVNITMEYPLRLTPVYSFFESLLKIQSDYNKQNRTKKLLYHRDFSQLIREPMFVQLLKARKTNLNTEELFEVLQKKNISFINLSTLEELMGDAFSVLKKIILPFSQVQDYNSDLIQLVLELIEYLDSFQKNQTQKLELEYLHLLLRNFNRMNELLKLYPHFHSFSAYYELFTQILGSATAPFSGEPLNGLQIMGLLESRSLDFEYLIFVNINEGILPSGKTMNSFLPNDLKRAFGLPLYTEKDAVYAYHFYRLLQKARYITISYDSESDTFGKGEKSRFVTQIELEIQTYNPDIKISEKVAGYRSLPSEKDIPIKVQKSDAVMNGIWLKASSADHYKGLSPSSLISFKECSLRFYFRYSAGLKETEEIEESAEQNTLGSILHLSLENLYRPLLNTELNVDLLEAKRQILEAVVHDSFISFFDNKEPYGKGLLQEEVVKVYVKKQLNQDVHEVKQLHQQKKSMKLLFLEEEFSANLKLNSSDVRIIFIKGKADRIDLQGNQLRIVDYKSSVKNTDKFEFKGFELLFSDPNYNKQLQLVIYAWLCYRNGLAPAENIRPCIIAFKNYRKEPYYLTENNAPKIFTYSFFEDFEAALKNFIIRIFDDSSEFVQTENKELCHFCAYRSICGRQ